MTLVKGGPNSVSLGPGRLRVKRAKLERALKSPHARKGDTPFLAWGDFHARSRFARSTIPEEKWGTTRSLRARLRIVGKRKIKERLSSTRGYVVEKIIN